MTGLGTANWTKNFEKLRNSAFQPKTTNSLADSNSMESSFTESWAASTPQPMSALMPSSLIASSESSNTPAPVSRIVAHPLKDFGQATRLEGLNNKTVIQALQTGINVSSPLLGAGLGASLQISEESNRVNATLRDSEGRQQQLPVTRTEIGVSVKLDSDRTLSLYSYQDTENLNLFHQKIGAIGLDFQDSELVHVAVSKYGRAPGVMSWSSTDSPSVSARRSLSSGENVPRDFWAITEKLTSKPSSLESSDHKPPVIEGKALPAEYLVLGTPFYISQ